MGPVLFLIYICDIGKDLLASTLLFVDDAKVKQIVTNEEGLYNSLWFSPLFSPTFPPSSPPYFSPLHSADVLTLPGASNFPFHGAGRGGGVWGDGGGRAEGAGGASVQRPNER